MATAYSLKIFTLSDPLIRDFINLPYQLHRRTACWVAPLKIQQKAVFAPKHPFWQTAECRLALVYDGNKAVGRIAAIRETSGNNDTLHFGFYESIDEQQVATMLFSFVKKIAKHNKLLRILGPVNPGINYELGLLSEGYDLFPKFMMPWTPPYYHTHFLKADWQVEKTFLAYELSVKDFSFTDKMERIQQYLHGRYQVQFRNMDFRNLTAETELIARIYNEAFRSHWGYQSFPVDEIKDMAREIKSIADRDLLLFVYLNQQPAGFIIALPDLNEVLRHLPSGRLFPFGWCTFFSRINKVKNVRVLNAAVCNQYRQSGVGVLLYRELHRRMVAKGYQSGELSWVVEGNVAMNSALIALGAKPVKAYRIYGTTLNDD